MTPVRTALAVLLVSLTLAGCAVYTPYQPYPVASAPVVGVYGGWGWGGWGWGGGGGGGWGGHRGGGYRHYR